MCKTDRNTNMIRASNTAKLSLIANPCRVVYLKCLYRTTCFSRFYHVTLEDNQEIYTIVNISNLFLEISMNLTNKLYIQGQTNYCRLGWVT